MEMYLVLYFFSSFMITNGNEITNLAPCNYTAIYNFGDSNSDTGGIAAAFYPPGPPSGITYFHRPAGRASDGRLIIDFIAEELGIPYLSPYLDSIGSNYKHGANFATGGATIQRPNESWTANGISPFSLDIQIEHFTQFRDRAAYAYNQAKDECIKQRVPKPDEDISKALFTLDIGQNDIAFGIRTMSLRLQLEALPKIVSQFITQVKALYVRGARTFWIHNTGPIGCLAAATTKVKDPAPGYLDEIGCVKYQNEICKQFNKQLRDEVVKVRAELADAAVVYVDMYAAKYDLISQVNKQGFGKPFDICCGYHGVGYDVWCGNRGNVDGREVYADSCRNASSVISWDGVHYTEAANHWIVRRILTGNLSDPMTAASTACHK
ncbi:GDSL esterase/lipase At5g14450 [Salvia hispanica]|uniref:GDSL esterase/lipase At5g14450 n=1 Tax=Salvia hispanica TaxID=49212 RepID=UPI0020095E71|nr:GDSL esterase/lipase At5g14450 [Salvia hispanica]